MKDKILLLGSNSFAASGLVDKLIENGFDIDLFLRGEENRIGNCVYGNIWNLSNNRFLKEQYDTVINFIIIKDSTVQENLKYIQELLKCCETKKVGHLIQISSISVYNNSEKYINEATPIEKKFEYKGIYASVKVAVDNYLISKFNSDLHISFVRPGFILSKDRIPPTAGICKILPIRIGLLLGNKKTVLPTIERETFHNVVVNILKLNLKKSVFLSLNNNTKYAFVKKNFNLKIIPLPKKLTLFFVKLLFIIKVFNKKQYFQVKGLFKTTYFDATKTEKILKLKFKE